MGKADKGRPQQIPMSNKINPAAGQSKPKKNHKICFFFILAPLLPTCTSAALPDSPSLLF